MEAANTICWATEACHFSGSPLQLGHIDDFPRLLLPQIKAPIPTPALTVLTLAADGFCMLDSQVSSLTSYLATDTDTEDRTVSSTDGYESPRSFTITDQALESIDTIG